MQLENLIIILAIGAVAGWLAGNIMKGRGFGIIGNILVGIVGAALGGYLFNVLDIAVARGIAGALITATVGAIALLFLVGLIRRV